MARTTAIIAVLMLALLRFDVPALAEERSKAGAIDFAEIWKRVREGSPRIQAAAASGAAAAERLDQARAFPNPEISVEAEDFGGSAGNAPWDAPEITYRVSQRLEIGGSRWKRAGAARAEYEAAEASRRVSVLEVWRDAVVAYAGVLAAERELDLARRNAELFGGMLRAIRARADAGKVAPLEVSRATAELSLGAAEVSRAAGALEAARLRLASLWGATEPDFEDAEGSLEAIAAIPSDSALYAGLAASPHLARLSSEVERAGALAGYEKRLRIPDLTVSAGLRRLSHQDERLYVAEVSLPIPLFDRNTGAVRAAERDREVADRELRSSSTALRAELARLLGEAAALEIEIAALREQAVPAAREAFAAVDIGYREGKYGYLDLLEAERSLVEAESRWIASLVEHTAVASEIGRLSGTMERFTFFGLSGPAEER